MRSGVFRVMVGCGLACSGCYSLFRVMWQEAALCMRRMRPGRVVLPRSLVISPAVLQSLLPASSAVSPGIMDGMWLLSGACILFTLTMFSSGLSDLRVMVSKRTVDNVQFLPFLTTDLNNLGWLYYGFLKGDGTLITVNSIGASLQTVYIVAFILYSAEKRPPIYQVLLSLGVLVLGYIYFYLWIPDVGARLNQLGLFCSVFTISMYLSPLTDLAHIIRTKCTQRLSFLLTVTTLLTSTSWVLYGVQRGDPYITVPNLPGIVTSIVRLWLFWRYRQEKPQYCPLQA